MLKSVITSPFLWKNIAHQSFEFFEGTSCFCFFNITIRESGVLPVPAKVIPIATKRRPISILFS